jgi:hypothetical protein
MGLGMGLELGMGKDGFEPSSRGVFDVTFLGIYG